MLECWKKSVRSEWAARSRESHPVWSCLAHTQLIQAACCLAVFLGQRQRQLQRQRRPVRRRADYQPLPVKLSFFQPIVRVLERISFWDMLFQSSQSIQKIIFYCSYFVFVSFQRNFKTMFLRLRKVAALITVEPTIFFYFLAIYLLYSVFHPLVFSKVVFVFASWFISFWI